MISKLYGMETYELETDAQSGIYKGLKIVRLIFLKLESRKLRACLEIRLKGLEENFNYFKYTNVTMFVIMPLTADSGMMIFILS